MATKTELDQFLKELKEDDNNEEGNYNIECPVKYTLGVIGGKWKLRILSQLLKKDVVRFNELKKKISGITNTMLSNSLNELAKDQLIIRNQYNEMPLRVEYELTDKGKSLLPLLYELSSWGKNQS
ncbi:HTH-type transcriptional activator HxlR [Clostridium puniceum]|uniref:HTH-type transcriptional activator HxlR n=1 Tax=Clostridium puniceum TaxID=29367 RepID=A0A1S8TKU9_9CLOT|nr:helix-turn-helix domain-containing protein [Clostridium puniceum]OOM78351.1 HTH-type transcriptional activator HxlR [Clostridium puniceum]